MNTHLDFREMIIRLVKFPDLHARFVNTLSLLEYMGARKILKSQRTDEVSIQTLAHASEEIRHAQMLKKLALKLSDGRLDSYSEIDLLCGMEAKKYFHSIDHAGIGLFQLKRSKENYLLTTLLIEERATGIYPVYEQVLNQMSIQNPLHTLIREEDRHLFEIRSKIQEAAVLTDDQLNELRSIEEIQFNSFIESLNRQIRTDK